MTASLHYCDDEAYAVELYDRVEVTIGGTTFDGEVRHIHTRAREVTVRYEDHHDRARTTGDPRKVTARVPLASVVLIGRDM